MGIQDVVSRTIKCEAEGCKNEIVFNPQSIEEIQKLPDWVRTYRNVSIGNKNTFGYCSDVCEVKGVTTGNHNVPEPKAVKPASSQAEINQAAQEAKNASDANKALKEGTIKLTDAE